MSSQVNGNDEMPPLEGDLDETNAAQTELNHVPQSNVVNNVENSDEDSNSDSDNWEMEGDEEIDMLEPTLCLFTDTKYPSIQSCIEGMKEKHNFDLFAVSEDLKLTQLDYIKFINYVRKNVSDGATDIIASIKSLNVKELSVDYMKPVIEYDPLLTVDMELEEDEEATDQMKLEHLRDIVVRQATAIQRLVAEPREAEISKGSKVSDMRLEDDTGYFSSYAHLGIHQEMIQDKVRTESYRDAIEKNSALINGKQILDLGCGTGILSMFAARAGAKAVTAVDMSDVIHNATEIVRENNLNSVITLRKGRVEDLEFDSKFDVIVSEWMGYFLLFEGMLDSVIYARNHHLSEGGSLLPNRCTMFIAGVADKDGYDRLVGSWSDVYGFKMSCVKRSLLKEAVQEVLAPEKVCTTAGQIADLDLMKISVADTEFSSDFSLKVKSDGQLTGLVGYFDTHFDLPFPVSFSTSPDHTPTHWKQTTFFLPEPRPVKEGEVLEGKISITKPRRDARALKVQLRIANLSLSYNVM